MVRGGGRLGGGPAAVGRRRARPTASAAGAHRDAAPLHKGRALTERRTARPPGQPAAAAAVVPDKLLLARPFLLRPDTFFRRLKGIVNPSEIKLEEGASRFRKQIKRGEGGGGNNQTACTTRDLHSLLQFLPYFRTEDRGHQRDIRFTAPEKGKASGNRKKKFHSIHLLLNKEPSCQNRC